MESIQGTIPAHQTAFPVSPPKSSLYTISFSDSESSDSDEKTTIPVKPPKKAVRRYRRIPKTRSISKQQRISPKSSNNSDYNDENVIHQEENRLVKEERNSVDVECQLKESHADETTVERPSSAPNPSIPFEVKKGNQYSHYSIYRKRHSFTFIDGNAPETVFSAKKGTSIFGKGWIISNNNRVQGFLIENDHTSYSVYEMNSDGFSQTAGFSFLKEKFNRIEFRKINIVLVPQDQTRVPVNSLDDLAVAAKKLRAPFGTTLYTSKLPILNFVGKLSLKFLQKSIISSTKNFVIENPSTKEIILSHGKVAENLFSFQSCIQMSPITAFSLSISMIESNP